MKKSMRLSDAGKALILIFGGVGLAGGTSYAVYQNVIKPDSTEQSSTTAPAGVDTLVNEFSAAVSAEAQAKMAEAQANAGRPAAVNTLCTDVAAMMAKLSTDSGISTKLIVTPYNQLTDSFEFGYCVLKAGDETVTFFTKGDELAAPGSRRYIIDELIENLPAADVVKIHNTLNRGAKAPQP
jgi:hypothetical protein